MRRGGTEDRDRGVDRDRRAFVREATLALTAGALGCSPLRSAWAQGGAGGPARGPIVETRAGKLRGGQAGPVTYFKGVHYGASTAGAHRFLPAAPVQPWSGVRDAVVLGLRSPQNASGLIPEVAAVDPGEPMGEDCLCLNVWTPGADSAQRRPVMLWLHGGGFSSGSGGFTIYDGTHLAAHHDVVVVTVNHRLNAFGFLYLPQLGGERYAQASNVGMRDIVLALQWVRDNIAQFGGDPGNVTLFGQSGGGAKVSTLMAMPAAQGLFHRAIVQSGSSLRAMTPEAATRNTAAYMEKLGLRSHEVDRLQTMSIDRLLAAMSGPANPAMRMAPVLDGTSLPAGPFDPVAPAMSASVPLLVGSTQDEVGFFAGYPLDPIPEAALPARIRQSLRCTDEQAARVIAAYREDQPGLSPIDVAMEVASDLFAWRNAITQAERKAAQAAAPAYMYYFTWKSPVRDGRLKAFHTLDIPFVFDNVDLAPSMTGTGADRYALQRRMSSAWVAFARNGTPDTPELPHWPAYERTRRSTMILGDRCQVVDDPRHDDRLALSRFPGRRL